MAASEQRRRRIAKLLEDQQVASQVQLVELLAGESIKATQATVSRDLDEMGAIKVRSTSGATVYALPEDDRLRPPTEDRLRRVLAEFVIDIAASGNIVLVTTGPGSAHVVASAIDRSSIEGVLGTVAGDDTLLVVVSEEVPGRTVAAALAKMAAL
ncbi:MAG: arginine repressor [Dehalococcoidia bacterium]